MSIVSVDELITKVMRELERNGMSVCSLKHTRVGFRKVERYFMAQGIDDYCVVTVEDFVNQTRSSYTNKEISLNIFGQVRRCVAILSTYYQAGSLATLPRKLREWRHLTNPLRQPPSAEQLSSKDDMLALVYRTKQELLKFGFAKSVMKSYTVSGFDRIMTYCMERGIAKYDASLIEAVVMDMRVKDDKRGISRSLVCYPRKAAAMLREFNDTGTLVWLSLQHWRTRQLTNKEFADALDDYSRDCEQRQAYSSKSNASYWFATYKQNHRSDEYQPGCYAKED